jgi:hypothetical protein
MENWFKNNWFTNWGFDTIQIGLMALAVILFIGIELFICNLHPLILFGAWALLATTSGILGYIYVKMMKKFYKK